MNVKNRLLQYITKQFIIGIVVGGILGFAYYYYIGCKSGTCAITSNPVNSILYGMLMGGVLGFRKRKEPLV